MSEDNSKKPAPAPPTKPAFNPPLKPNFPGLNNLKKPNFGNNPRFGNNAFRNQNRGSGGK